MNLQEHIQPLTPVAAAKLQSIVSDLRASARHLDRRYVPLRRMKEVAPNAPPEHLADLLFKALQDSDQIKNFAAGNLSPEMEKLQMQLSVDRMTKAMQLLSDLLKQQSDLHRSFAQTIR